MRKSASSVNLREEHKHYNKIPTTLIRPSSRTNGTTIFSQRMSNSSNRTSRKLKINKSTLNSSASFINLIPLVSKEKLYEETIHLKKVVNKLTNHLAIMKKDVRKKDTNLFLKDKIIENSILNIPSNKEKLFDKLIDSNNISKIKNAFGQLKIEYLKVKEDNNNRKQSIRYSRPFDTKGKNEKLQSDLIDLMKDYNDLQKENSLIEIEIDEAIALTTEFNIQHQMLSVKENEYEESKKRIGNLNQRVQVLSDELTANENSKKKLSMEKLTMMRRIEKLNTEKRNQELFMRAKPAYDLKIKELTQKVDDYKSRAGNNDKMIKRLRKDIEKLMKLNQCDKTKLKPINYNDLKQKEAEPHKHEDPKILLLQSMINESEQNQKKMMLKIQSDAQMLEEFGIRITSLESIKQEINTMKIDKPLIPDVIHFNEPKLNSQGQIKLSSPSVNSNGRVKSFENLQNNLKDTKNKSQEMTEQNSNSSDDYQNMLYVIIKCLEGKNIPSGVVLEKMLTNIIFPQTNPNMNKELFLQTMTDNIIALLDCNEKDTKDISKWFEKMYLYEQNDLDKVLGLITSLFGNIREYPANEDLLYSKKIKKALLPYKEKIQTKFDKYFKESNGFITYNLLQTFLVEEKIELSDTLSEYLFYKLKQFPKTPNISIYDLDMKILNEIFENSLNDSKMYVKTEEDGIVISKDDYIKVIKDFIVLLKNYLTKYKTTIRQLLANEIQIADFKGEVIHIDSFVKEMEKINIILYTEKEQFCLFNKYRCQDDSEYLSIRLIENDINFVSFMSEQEDNKIMENVQEEDDESIEK